MKTFLNVWNGFCFIPFRCSDSCLYSLRIIINPTFKFFFRTAGINKQEERFKMICLMDVIWEIGILSHLVDVAMRVNCKYFMHALFECWSQQYCFIIFLIEFFVLVIVHMNFCLWQFGKVPTNTIRLRIELCISVTLFERTITMEIEPKIRCDLPTVFTDSIYNGTFQHHIMNQL